MEEEELKGYTNLKISEEEEDQEDLKKPLLKSISAIDKLKPQMNDLEVEMNNMNSYLKDTISLLEKNKFQELEKRYTNEILNQ